jgi:hypothetical protein
MADLLAFGSATLTSLDLLRFFSRKEPHYCGGSDGKDEDNAKRYRNTASQPPAQRAS